MEGASRRGDHRQAVTGDCDPADFHVGVGLVVGLRLFHENLEARRRHAALTGQGLILEELLEPEALMTTGVVSKAIGNEIVVNTSGVVW